MTLSSSSGQLNVSDTICVAAKGKSPAMYIRSKDETFSELEHELNGGGCGCDGRYF
ncbi:hypothetical protein F2Q69_00033151 [Brassica cretica]|uniref:Uncharacterized protein n=1 Tax=Brassica cretica TaxID=69181 RepID=A0A8S9SL03_BRACR|nr:hypothetical protein F2Q69_00033151 [Brassica cretica]